MDAADRVIGCVVGLALGDALGAPFEFQRRDRIPHPLPAFELPWMGHAPGSTTDDTAMALNLTRSLVAREGFDPDDVVARHLAWFRSDPPDVGTLTRRVLQRVGEARQEGSVASLGTLATAVARSIWEERGPEVSAGNGSVMSCPPLGCAYANRAASLLELAPALSALTHHDERCRTAVLAVTLSVAGLVRGEPADAAVSTALRTAGELQGGEELAFLVDAVGDVRRVDGPDQGFVLYAAAAGLQAVLRDGSFEVETRRVVALGGDTDTNVAVAGALLGARDGAEGLPMVWLERLHGRGEIERDARALAALAVAG